MNSTEIAKLVPILIPIILIELALMVAAIVDLIRHPKTRILPRWVWVLLVLFFQIFGPILYFIIGRE
jgi:Phospholipase_D-nuclease N-terminal